MMRSGRMKALVMQQNVKDKAYRIDHTLRKRRNFISQIEGSMCTEQSNATPSNTGDAKAQ